MCGPPGTAMGAEDDVLGRGMCRTPRAVLVALGPARQARVHWTGTSLCRHWRGDGVAMDQPPGSFRTRARREVHAHHSGDDRGQGHGRGIGQDALFPAWVEREGGRLGPGRQAPAAIVAVRYLCAALPILIVLGRAASALGSVSVRTPCSNCAAARSASTGPGRVIERA